MTRLSANLGFLWPERPLLERIDAAAAAGFRAIELHWPYDVPAHAVRARCEAHGVTLLGVNTARGRVANGEMGLGAVPGRETEFQATIDQAIGYCIEAGGSAVHCMAGKVAAGHIAEARDVLINNLRQASAKAAPHGLTLLLEPLNPHDAPGYFYSTVEEGAAVVADVGCANVRLMFDCYHASMVGGDVLESLAAMLPVVGHVQVADRVPGRGVAD